MGWYKEYLNDLAEIHAAENKSALMESIGSVMVIGAGICIFYAFRTEGFISIALYTAYFILHILGSYLMTYKSGCLMLLVVLFISSFMLEGLTYLITLCVVTAS